MKLFQNFSSIKSENCNLLNKEKDNKKLFHYQVNNSNNINNYRTSNNISLSYQCMNLKDGIGWIDKNGKNIDNDSFFRNRDGLTNKNEIQQLFTRQIKTLPYRKTNKTINIDLESNLIQDKLINKDNNNLIDYDFTQNTFHPLLINNNNNITENCNWVRGGEPSRERLKDKNFLRKIGYKYNGKFWFK